MLNTTLPTHVLTGATAVGWRKPRPGETGMQPIWPILGASEDGGDGTAQAETDGDEGADDGQESDGTDGDDGQDDAAEDLGDKGKKALRELRRENRQLKSQLRASTKGTQSSAKADEDGEVDADAIREQARTEARAEVWTERVESAAVAAASGRLANPQLASRLLDLSDIGEDAKGKPDRAALNDLIDELLEEEPYLAAKSAKDTGRRFEGGADGGARKSKKTAASLEEAVANRLAGKSG